MRFTHSGIVLGAGTCTLKPMDDGARGRGATIASMTAAPQPLDIAIPLFDRFTALDAVGPYEVLSRLPGAAVAFVAEAEGPVTNDSGSLTLVATTAVADASRPDVVVVPGGPGHASVPGPILEWLATVHPTTRWTSSVCTGSLVLGAAGLLRGVRATTHWLTLEDLDRYGADVVRERVVVDEAHRIVTAAGVSAGLDMSLALAALLAGDTVAQAIQLLLEYDPRPPFDAGSPQKAPAAVVELLTARAGGRAGGD